MSNVDRLDCLCLVIRPQYAGHGLKTSKIEPITILKGNDIKGNPRCPTNLWSTQLSPCLRNKYFGNRKGGLNRKQRHYGRVFSANWSSCLKRAMIWNKLRYLSSEQGGWSSVDIETIFSLVLYRRIVKTNCITNENPPDIGTSKNHVSRPRKYSLGHSHETK